MGCQAAYLILYKSKQTTTIGVQLSDTPSKSSVALKTTI